MIRNPAQGDARHRQRHHPRRTHVRGAQDINLAVAYTPNVQAVDYPGGQGGPTFTLRGFDANNFDSVYQDGLRYGFNSFDQNIAPYAYERIDVVKGPISVLYGQGQPGGIINLVSKRPTFVSSNGIFVQGGNYGRVQAGFDLSGPVEGAPRFAYRVTGLVRNADSQVRFTPDDRAFIAPAVTWRPDSGHNSRVVADSKRLWQASSMDTANFIERRFNLRLRGEIRTAFSRPEPITAHLWQCSYRFVWPDHEVHARAYGLDGVQALLLAMELVHLSLLAEVAYRKQESSGEADVLMWQGQSHLALPGAGTTDVTGLHEHVLGEQRNNRDLDHVILRECVPQFRKVAMIASSTLRALGHRCRSTRLVGEMGNHEADPYLDTVLARIEGLVVDGGLEAQGALAQPRFSEVRLKAAGSA